MSASVNNKPVLYIYLDNVHSRYSRVGP
jgi:hypothetical protein